MEITITQIRPVALLFIVLLHCIFAALVWFRGRSKESFHLGWTSFFSAVNAFSWAGVFIFQDNKLFWTRATWLGCLIIPAYMVFIYYFTGKTKNLKWKALVWYGLAFFIILISLFTPYVVSEVSDQYPYITLESGGPLNATARLFVIIGGLFGFYYLIVGYLKSEGERKKQTKYFIWGLAIYFVGGFLFNGFLPMISPEKFFSFLDVANYFSVFWLGLTIYAIFKKELFEIRILMAEFLVMLIGSILFIQIFLFEDIRTKIIEFIIFLLFCLIGYLLTRATHREINKEKEANKLTAELGELNKDLAQKVKQGTTDLQQKVSELGDSKKALMNILEDIEKTRKVVEEEKNKTMAIIANLADGLLVFDNRGVLSLINPRAEYFFEISHRKAVGQTLKELASNSYFKLLTDLLGSEGREVFRQEMVVRDLTLEVSSIPITSEQGRTGILIVLHDISREKVVEKMKTEFVSIAAHQLRTPLSAIKWALSLLLEGDTGQLNDDQKSIVEKSYASNERMIRLITDLLDVARIEEGRYIYKLEPANLDKLVQASVDAFKELAGKRQITLQYQKPIEPAPQTLVDTEKISITVQNLVENAIKYTPSGGSVTISLKYDKNNIEIAVKDTGIGISESQTDRLFTKFFRASNVVLMETDGSGLGLFIAKNIIEAHGGRIWCESQENKGSTFAFSLPIRKK